MVVIPPLFPHQHAASRSPAMRYLSVPLLALASVVCLTPLTAIAQTNQKNLSHSGDVLQSIPPPISQKTTPPPLDLSDDQRAKIKQVLQGHGFPLKPWPGPDPPDGGGKGRNSL